MEVVTCSAPFTLTFPNGPVTVFEPSSWILKYTPSRPYIQRPWRAVNSPIRPDLRLFQDIAERHVQVRLDPTNPNGAVQPRRKKIGRHFVLPCVALVSHAAQTEPTSQKSRMARLRHSGIASYVLLSNVLKAWASFGYRHVRVLREVYRWFALRWSFRIRLTFECEFAALIRDGFSGMLRSKTIRLWSNSRSTNRRRGKSGPAAYRCRSA